MPKRSFSCSMQSNDEGQFLINNLKDSKDSGKQTGPRKGAQEGSWTPTLCLSAFSAVIGAALPMGYNNGVLNTPEVSYTLYNNCKKRIFVSTPSLANC